MKKIVIGALTLLTIVTSCNEITPKSNQLFSKEAMDYIQTVPFDVNRTSLYSAEELYAGYRKSHIIPRIYVQRNLHQ